MTGIDEARIDAVLRSLEAQLPSLTDINMEPAPLLRAQRAEVRRVGVARIAAIGNGRALGRKAVAHAHQCRDSLSRSADAAVEMRRRSEAARTDSEASAWLTGCRCLLGEVSADEMPGAIIAMARELGVHGLPTVPTCEEALQAAERDVAACALRLQSELDAAERWLAAPQKPAPVM